MRFLVTEHVPEGFVSGLEALGFAVDRIDQPDRTTLAAVIPAYQGILLHTGIKLDRDMLDKATQLRYILRPGSGLDNVDLKAAKEKNMLVFNSPEANADAVGEHALGLLLGLLRHIPRSFMALKDGKWQRHFNTGTQLNGKTVGIIGFGNTGQAFAAKLRGFNVQILAHDKYKTGFGNDFVKEETLESLQQNCDIISLHVPLTDETKHLGSDKFFSVCTKPIILLNTSRGGVVDTHAVFRGIENGKIAAAGLDVLENEHLESYSGHEKELLDSLLASGKVIITPHIAGWTNEARRAIYFTVLDKFAIYLQQVRNSPASDS